MRRMRLLVAGLLLLLVAQVAVAADPTPEELKQKFQETLSASRMVLEFKGDKIGGPGAAYLKTRIEASQFVLIGEEHGVGTIADTVRAMLPTFGAAGYRYFAIEVDPYTTAKLEGLLRSGGAQALAGFLNSEDRRFAVPFYNWSGEAALADAFVRANDASSPALWGFDQLFIGAAAVHLSDIASGASNPEARALAATLAGQAKGNLEFLGKADLAALAKLRALLGDDKDRALAQMVDDMILSARIYQPFVGVDGGLSVYAANLERENLMKRLFHARYQAAGKPKVFFKFGAYHMMRGLSGTHVPSLGNFVADVAQAEGKSTFHLLILCGPGTKAGDLMGNPVPCSLDVAKDFPDLVRHVDAKVPTLFDLGPWKDKPRRWAHLSENVRSTIWAFDAILFVPNGKSAAALK